MGEGAPFPTPFPLKRETMSTALYDAYQILAGSGKVIAVATSEATDTVILGQVYILTTNTDCYIRFSGSAVTTADDNFDLFMPAGSTAVLKATNATIRAIRNSADGILGISRVEQI